MTTNATAANAVVGNAAAAVAASIAVEVAADNAVAAKMIHPRANVASALRVALEKGLEIKALRIRYQEDLDEARAAKLKWTAATHSLLIALFDNPSVADYCNDWVGKIFPEYAEFGNFVEQFYEEMEHRVGKLRSVLLRVEQVSDLAPAPIAIPTPTGDAPEAAAVMTAPPPPVASGAPVVVARPVAPTTFAPEPPVATHVVIIGAPATDSSDPTHSAAAEFLKQLGIAARAVDDAAACDNTTGAVVFVLASQPAEPTAAQRVVFKLGCAVGRLGAKRVCVVHAPGVAPIAEGNVTHVAIDAAGAWHLPFARQLKAAGMAVDLNKLC